MTRKTKVSSQIHQIPAQLTTIEHQIFIASWLDAREARKRSNSITVYGIDLLSRKICPDLEMLYSMVTEIINFDISADNFFSAEFIIPRSIAKKVLSSEFAKETIENREDLLDIWISIATHETIEFINHLLKRVKIDPISYPKAKTVIERLLQHYGTGQLWNLAYRANQRACEVILSQNIEVEERSDLYLDIFIQKGMQHIENGWKLDPFKRWGFQCRQSEYSKFFFDHVLGISEDGFNKKPCISLLPE
jgi:hypothetical protein